MTQPPSWYAEAVTRHAARVAAGDETGQQAIAALRVLVRDDHPEYGNGVLDAHNQREFKSALTLAHLTLPDPAYSRHLALFPDFPFRQLRVSPSLSCDLAAMTARDLDNAKRMLLTRTGNAERGARAQRARFMAFYKKVHPVMHDGDTVADAEARLLAVRNVQGELFAVPA